MKCLSVRQPWADLILDKGKVEIRSWATKFRGRVLIHASTIDYVECSRLGVKPGQFGVVIGIADLVVVRPLSGREWKRLRRKHFVSGPRPYGDKTYGWFFKNPQRFSEPLYVRGMLGLFNVRDSLVPALKQPNAS